MIRKHTDPTSFIEATGVWAAINAFAVVLSGPSLYSRPGFLVLRELHIPREMLIGVFIGDAASILVSVLMQSLPFRATVTLMSAILWLLYGLASLYSFYHLGIISISGMWSVACGLGCLNAVSQWAYVGDRR